MTVVSARRKPDTGRDRAEGADVPAQAEGNLHLLLHVESRAVRILRQFWGLQVPCHAIRVLNTKTSFRLYGDEALDNALNTFVKLLLSIPQTDLLDYPKLSQTYYVLLECLAQDHMAFLATLEPQVI